MQPVEGPGATPVASRRVPWTLRRWVVSAAAVSAAFAVLAIIGGAIGIARLTDARERLADELDPAVRTARQLSAALVNQETGVRGYLLARDPQFLEPYTGGLAEQEKAVAELRGILADRYPQAIADLDAVLAAARRWRAEYADPTIAGVRAGQLDSVPPPELGKTLFDNLRGRLGAQEIDLEELRAQSREALADAARSLERIAVGIGLALVIGVGALTVGLRRGVTGPVHVLADQVRVVAGGDFQHPVRGVGPAELVDLGGDVDAMRERILAELSAVRDAHRMLDSQARELERSNAELEQFAYVASHDLQEPLRKVASFCQLLGDRYRDTLDDRAKQYIDFAVDGATRMQALINDLLAFSRVGRLRGESRFVDVGSVVDIATSNLSTAVEESGASITTGTMPTVYGDAALLVVALQNLFGNAIKFRRPDEPPRISLIARPERDNWLFVCADNGIGIESAYAERIFTIFQRLHPRDVYAGTGIGLAMVRKIVEYHGGRIWLDTAASAEGVGSTFCFTLPKNPPLELTERSADD